MVDDPAFGAKTPVSVQAVWKDGVVQSTQFENMVCHGPPMLSKDAGDAAAVAVPSVLSYCPILAAGCSLLVYMIHAASQGTQFGSYDSTTETTGDLTCLFKTGQTPKSPWVTVNQVTCIQSDSLTQEELQAYNEHTHRHCPSVEMVESDFHLEAKLQGTQVELASETKNQFYYNIDKYKELAAQSGPILVKQQAELKWFTQNESTEYPDTLAISTSEGVTMLFSQEAPMASGKYPNPVQLCAFGALAFYMHTVAIRLAVHGYQIAKMEGRWDTTMNKRKVLGVEHDTKVFLTGACLFVTVESNAPDEVIQEVEKEAKTMSPLYLGVTRSSKMVMTIQKVE